MRVGCTGLAVISLSAACGRIGFDPSDAGEDVVIGEPRTCRDMELLGLPTGVHTLDPDRDGPSAPRDVWCEQERRGGGWSLALKIDGAQPTFRGDETLWEDTVLLNPSSLDPAVPDEAKLAPYLDEDLAEVMLVVEGGADVVLRMRGPSLGSLIASGLTFPTATPEAEWRGAFADPGLQDGCRRQGIGITNLPSPNYGRVVRIGLLANNENSECDTADSVIGVGATLQCVGPQLVAAGNVLAFDININVCEPRRVLVYVRGDDQTRFASQPSCAAHLARGRTDDGLYVVDGVPRRCDMTTDGGGWTNALDFDGVRDRCPAPWATDPTDPALCIVPGVVDEVSSITIPSPLAEYREVMAAVTGFQRGTSDAFNPPGSIDGAYVDGLSITTGSPRQHIATFGSGHNETSGCTGPINLCNCPCLGGVPPPSFVRAGEFRCEAGALQTPGDQAPLRPDPLFDGAETPPSCSTEASIEPIRTTLASPTSTPLEARLMRDEPGQGEGLAVYRFALWVR